MFAIYYVGGIIAVIQYSRFFIFGRTYNIVVGIIEGAHCHNSRLMGQGFDDIDVD